MLETKKFDVIIPVAKKDLSFLPRVVDYVNRCIDGINIIYVLTSNSHEKRIKNKLSRYHNCVIVDENRLIAGLDFDRVKILLDKYAKNKQLSVGWYYQQFLKFAFAKSSICSDYYLSWDADTLPLAPINFFSSNHILFNPKKEYNPNYFKTINNLFGYGKVAEISFISESMMFCSAIVREMLNDIEKSNAKGDDWIEKIVSSCDFSSSIPAFSEFETYGSYCFIHYPDLYKMRHLNTFREAGMICGRRISESRLRIMSFDIDMASFEMRDEPVFPLNIPHILYRIKNNLFISPKEFCYKIVRKLNPQSKIDNIPDNILYRLPSRGE